MAGSRLRKGDTVKVIAGGYKGETGKIARVDAVRGHVYIEALGMRKRTIKPSQLNPRGGTREVHTPVAISNVMLSVGDKGQTTRVGYGTAKDGSKIRLARALKNKEITS